MLTDQSECINVDLYFSKVSVTKPWGSANSYYLF
jgi:hypothetical protein